MKALEPSESICENNIKYTRLPNGDGLFTVYGTINAERFHRCVGKESEGVTRFQAEEVYDKLKQDMREQRFQLPKGRKYEPRFEEVIKEYIERLKQTGGKIVERKEQHLTVKFMPLFKNKSLKEITTFDIERFKNEELNKGASSATINRWLCTLSHLYTKAIEWGWIEYKPCIIKQFKENNARIVYMTAEQIKSVLDIAKTDPYPIIYPFILIALETAMRRSEILSIRLEDIDIDKRVIFIPKAKAGAREQPMTERLATYLSGYVQGVDNTQPWLFPSNKSKSGHYEALEYPWRRVLRAAGLDPYLYVRHSLRHTAISHLVQSGVDLPTVMRISGHKSLQMVQRYSHQNGAHIQDAMKKLEARYSIT